MSDWTFIDELGGIERTVKLLRDFYDRLYDDVIVGFLFQPHDKERLVRSQLAYLSAHLGDRSGTYEGLNMRAAHKHVPVLSGQFDRRHQILTDVIHAWDVPQHVRDEWLALDRSLRPLVVNLGAEERDRALVQDKKSPRDEDPEG